MITKYASFLAKPLLIIAMIADAGAQFIVTWSGCVCLLETIRLAQIAEKGINKHLMKPQDIEYEKTFWPFILISKKRYTGDKYEFNPDECKRNAMGIVLKRRDNAPIVKHVFGNVIEKIMTIKNMNKIVVS